MAEQEFAIAARFCEAGALQIANNFLAAVFIVAFVVLYRQQGIRW
ncbi:hypothetical protein [Intestinirhabdus alba]|jgi:hypothetical protein|nr:hypothetical protein [Intestinirhabdus alba]